MFDIAVIILNFKWRNTIQRKHRVDHKYSGTGQSSLFSLNYEGYDTICSQLLGKGAWLSCLRDLRSTCGVYNYRITIYSTQGIGGFSSDKIVTVLSAFIVYIMIFHPAHANETISIVQDSKCVFTLLYIVTKRPYKYMYYNGEQDRVNYIHI